MGSAGGARPRYARREPEATVLHKIVREHLETLLAEARAGDPSGRGLPRHVEEEFRAYLKCGVLAEGFTLLRCTRCGEETVVAFSCKTRTFCPSCLTRRMHSVALDLVERVLPVTPYRHWVLALPVDLRFLLARDERLLAKVRAIFVRSVRGWLHRCARMAGLARPLTGAVVFTQRFSSRLLLYPHFHAVFPDGAFAEDEAGKLVFHALRPRQEDLERIVARIARKAAKLLARLDLDSMVPDSLDRLRAQAAQGELALKVAAVEQGTPSLLARAGGFSLQAARHLHAHDREGLAFLVRYNLRPPLSLARLSERPGGKVLLRFKRPLADGTAALELEPLAFLRRLASLVPPPGSHDTAYFGIFASHCAWRRRFVAARRGDAAHCPGHPGLGVAEEEIVTLPADGDAAEEAEAQPEERCVRGADLMRKVWGLEVLDCPCGGKRKFVEEFTAPEKTGPTLERLGLWKAPPEVTEARRPPQAQMFDEFPSSDGVDPPAPDYAA